MPLLERRPTTSHAAYDLYLRGLRATLTPTEESIREAHRCFESATRIDPAFSLAYAAWGYSCVLSGGIFVPFKEAGPRAKELARRALELDPDSSEAHALDAMIAHQVDLDWKRAELQYRAALTLNPGNAIAHFWHSVLLATTQRFEEAEDEARETIRLEPMSEEAWRWLAQLHYLSGDIYSATARAEELRDLAPESFIDRLTVGYCYAAAGRVADALHEAELCAGPPDLGSRVGRAVLFAILGRPAEAAQLAKELEARSRAGFVPELWIADLHAAVGEADRAIELLEHDFRDGERTLWLEYQFPQFDQLRSDPRFVALLRQYDLPSVRTVRLLVVPRGPEGPKPPGRLPA